MIIESSSNPRFRYWKREILGVGRREGSLALVSGAKLVREHLEQAPEAVRYLLLRKGMSQPSVTLPRFSQVVHLAGSLFTELDVFGTKSPLLLVQPPQLEVLPEGELKGLWLALPFQDPGNLGGTARTALGLGVAGAILLPGSASPWHPKSIRASAGAVFRLPMFLARDDTWMRRAPVVALDAGGTDIRTVQLPKDLIFLPGREGPGLDTGCSGCKVVALPMAPELESFNAMVAVSLAVYEWRRRQD